MAFSASGDVAKAERRVKSAQSHLDSLLYATPSPSESNVSASEQNIADLEAVMAKIREDLERGSVMETSTDGVSVMAGIQQFISDHQRLVSENMDADGEAAPIAIEDDFAFGFDRYLDGATPFESDSVNSDLDKQRQILAYILAKLINSQPEGIEAVERELLEIASDEAAKAKDGFIIDEAISARVTEAIDTLAFSVTFSGYTNSLRVFLNNLAEFEMPIVVRSIEVERPKGSETVAAASSSSGGGFDAIFGAFGAPDSSAAEEETQKQQPVITDTASKFTIVLEFIEIVLENESNDEEPS